MADLSSRQEWLRGWRLPAVLAGLFLVTAVVRSFLRKRRLIRVRRDFGRWQVDAGWMLGSVDRVWPWATLIRAPDMVTVASAYDGERTGFPATVGEVSWIDNGFGEAVDRWSGHGVFAIVRLPGSPPDLAVRRFRTAYRQRADEDEFRRRFRTIASDTVDFRRLEQEALRNAHVNGEIPPWTLRQGELFTIVPIDGIVTPAAMESALAGALRVVELLGLRSDQRRVT